jgi:DNA-binding LacI/PurR family transcriptional regulator
VNLGTSIDIVREIRYSVTERISETLTFFQKGISVDARKRRPSLVDIAQHANVSPATVSRVLNNTAPVRESVRARVLNSLTALGYQPPTARATWSVLRDTIALIIPDILNPYFPEIVRGVQDEAGLDGFLPLLLDTAEDPQREQQFIRMLASQPVNGVIVCGSRLPVDDLIAIRTRHTVPMVLLNRSIHHPEISCVIADTGTATYRATHHLLDLNHQRIAYLPGPAASEASQARQRGVETALKEAGLTLREEWCPASFPNVNGGFQAMSALLALPPDKRPTAVIAYNDVMALGVLHAIRAHHLRVPEDISVIGMDDIAMAAHANPPLTTIAQPKYRMGRLAMQILRRMIQGHPPPEDGYTLVESSLIIRESTAPAPNNGNHS